MNDLQNYLIHEFVADYKQGLLSRRDLIRRVLYITGGLASTATVLSALGCGPASQPTPTVAGSAGAVGAGQPAASPGGQTAAASPAASPSGSPSPVVGRSPLSVPPNDPSIDAADIAIPGDGVSILAYQARPKGAAGPYPVVLVCHENQGLTEHIRDVTRRFAKEGYLACALDLLSREGGTRNVPDPARIPGLLTNAPPERHVGDFQAALRYYAGQSDARRGAYAMTGFCFGGGITWRAATRIPELRATAAWYGPPPPLEEVPNIKAAVFGIYSSDPQDFANNGKAELEAALKQAGITYQLKTYPGTQHAFNNDTGPRYAQEQALAAWRDVLDWFGRYVRTSVTY